MTTYELLFNLTFVTIIRLWWPGSLEDTISKSSLVPLLLRRLAVFTFIAVHKPERVATFRLLLLPFKCELVVVLESIIVLLLRADLLRHRASFILIYALGVVELNSKVLQLLDLCLEALVGHLLVEGTEL